MFNVLEKDAVRLQAVYGEGIASYTNDGGMDLAPAADWDAGVVTDLEAEAVPLTGVLANYDHWSNDQRSSSIGYSFTEVGNTNFQDPGPFEMIDYASGNLLYYPADNVMLGGELMWGKRTNSDGASEDGYRFQFTVKYNVGTTP